MSLVLYQNSAHILKLFAATVVNTFMRLASCKKWFLIQVVCDNESDLSLNESLKRRTEGAPTMP